MFCLCISNFIKNAGFKVCCVYICNYVALFCIFILDVHGSFTEFSMLETAGKKKRSSKP